MPTIAKQSCPTCGQSVNEREIALFSGMVSSLLRVFRWCEERGRYEFTRKEIKHLLTSDNEIARFGDWVLFGGLVYRPDDRRGHYGLNEERVRAFLRGGLAIPTSIWKNPLTGELTKDSYCYIREVKNLQQFLVDNQEYLAKYR
jgi:hypothetical protein